jgi:hypothetical protein
VQNLTVSGIWAPHEEQIRPATADGAVAPNGLPQEVQNFRPEALLFPQIAHAGMIVFLRYL